MGLSCSCDNDDADWYYNALEDFTVLKTKRSRKCTSCKVKIIPGNTVLEFYRYRSPRHEIEEVIYDDQVPLASWYMCETCGGLYMAVDELGMCCDITYPISEQIKEYQSDQF